jgi:uncharacterized membrane protein YfbV (UPF0208 family)
MAAGGRERSSQRRFVPLLALFILLWSFILAGPLISLLIVKIFFLMISLCKWIYILFVAALALWAACVP